MNCTLKKVLAAVLAAIMLLSVGSIKVQANDFAEPGHPEDYELYDLVVKAGKVGLLTKNYETLESFKPNKKASANFCKTLLKRAAKNNGLDVKKISGKEASFDWMMENIIKLDVPRPEWLDDPDLWSEFIHNLRMETNCLYGQGEKLTRIKVLYLVELLFFPNMPIGYDYTDEAIAMRDGNAK